MINDEPDLAPPPTVDVVDAWLRDGQLCVLLDGLDEIQGDTTFTERLKSDLTSDAWHQTPLVLACRTVSFEAHQAFSPGFAVYRVGELTREQRDHYIHAYPAQHPAQFESEELIQQLDRLPAMEPLWGNPLLLSLICFAVGGTNRVSLPARAQNSTKMWQRSCSLRRKATAPRN